MNYAIVELAGKQFKVSAGEKIQIEKPVKPIDLRVLMYVEEDKNKIGNPYLNDFPVEYTIDDRIIIIKTDIGRFKSKSRYRKLKGHKQPYISLTFTRVGEDKIAPKVIKNVVSKTEINKEENTEEIKKPKKTIDKKDQDKKTLDKKADKKTVNKKPEKKVTKSTKKSVKKGK